MTIDRIERRAVIIKTKLRLNIVACVGPIRPELPRDADADPSDLHEVFERIVQARVFSVAPARGRALETDQRECTRTTHRIVGNDAIERQCVLPAICQRAPSWRAEPGPGCRIECLAILAGIGEVLCDVTGTPLFCTIDPNPSDNLPDVGRNDVCKLNMADKPGKSCSSPLRPMFEAASALGATPKYGLLLFFEIRYPQSEPCAITQRRAMSLISQTHIDRAIES